jgi:hypothetical protein
MARQQDPAPGGMLLNRGFDRRLRLWVGIHSSHLSSRVASGPGARGVRHESGGFSDSGADRRNLGVAGTQRASLARQGERE